MVMVIMHIWSDLVTLLSHWLERFCWYEYLAPATQVAEELNERSLRRMLDCFRFEWCRSNCET